MRSMRSNLAQIQVFDIGFPSRRRLRLELNIFLCAAEPAFPLVRLSAMPLLQSARSGFPSPVLKFSMCVSLEAILD